MSKPIRIQSAFISEKEVKKVVDYLKDQFADQLQDTVNLTKDSDEEGGSSKTIFDIAQEAEDEEELDDKYEEALRTVVRAGKASTSYLQRKLRVGYSRAARIMDELEENGVISEKDGTKAREVLISKEVLEKAASGASFDDADDEEDDYVEDDPDTMPSDDDSYGAGSEDEDEEYDEEGLDESEDNDDYTEEDDVSAGDEEASEIDDKYFDALEDEDEEEDE